MQEATIYDHYPLTISLLPFEARVVEPVKGSAYLLSESIRVQSNIHIIIILRYGGMTPTESFEF